MDRDSATCAGGLASVDFIIEREREFAGRIADIPGIGQLRANAERQRNPLVTLAGERRPCLNDARRLMEAYFEDPLTTDEIAHFVGVPWRQLVSLFHQYLSAMPSKYHLGLMIAKARTRVQRPTSR